MFLFEIEIKHFANAYLLIDREISGFRFSFQVMMHQNTFLNNSWNLKIS